MPRRIDDPKGADLISRRQKSSRSSGDSGKSEQLLPGFAREQSEIPRKKPGLSISHEEFDARKPGKNLVNRANVIEMSVGERDCADRASQILCRLNNSFAAPG